MKKELKQLMALKLLNWSFSIMPDSQLKIELAKLISREITPTNNCNGTDDCKDFAPDSYDPTICANCGK